MLPENYLPPITDELVAIVDRTFAGQVCSCFMVSIQDYEYQLCEEVSKIWWARFKSGTYGRGLGRTDDDPDKPVRTGLLGQMAFGKLFHAPVDLKYREYGDEYDNLIGGNRIDVKCSMRNFGTGLIYHTNERGRRIPLNKDLYVFGFVQSEIRQKGVAVVVFVGFVSTLEVEACEVKPGRKGRKDHKRHLNYEVPFGGMRPIAELQEILNV